MRILDRVDLDELDRLRRERQFFWLDLDDPAPDALMAVGRRLGLHDLALEDTREFGQRPKLEAYEHEMLLVYFGASLDERGAPSPVEVHLHITSEFVVSVHRVPCERFTLVQEQLRARPPDDENALIYRVIDALTDAILDVLDSVDDRVECFEQEIFLRPRARDRDEMAQLRHSLGPLRRVLVVQRQVFERTVERLVVLPGANDSVSAYYRDVGDHLWRAVDEVEAARDSLQGLLDTYSNEVQERLTIVATIFLPLTVLTGFFGQNFNWLINHIGSAAAFWGLGLGGLVVAGTGITAWLLVSGLLKGPRRWRRR